jgi:hypothetical protein
MPELFVVGSKRISCGGALINNRQVFSKGLSHETDLAFEDIYGYVLRGLIMLAAYSC